MKGSDFIFNGVNYLFYDFSRITISKGGSCNLQNGLKIKNVQ